MCDTFCIRRPGGLLFAKSSDRPPDESQIVEWFGRRDAGTSLRTTYLTIPDTGAAALLASRPTWMWGLEHGINEHRVAIGNEKVWTVDDPRAVPPALLGMDLVRLGLERSRNADDALDVMTDLLAEHGQGGTGEEGRDEPYWSSFLVVDPRGGWVLETSGTSWVAAPVGAGAAISNRLTLRSDWTRSSADVEPGANWDRWRAPEAPTGIADHRLVATRRCVALGASAGPAQAAAALRDHGTGPWGEPGTVDDVPAPVPSDVGEDWSGVTVCMHVAGFSCTTASMVADLPDGDGPVRVWASLGTPCTGVFLPIAVPGRDAVVPGVLGSPDAWRSFSALSRAVERPGEEGAAALAEVRAALAPVEAEAWAEADELWERDADAPRWRAAADAWSVRVEGVLDELRSLLT